MDRSYWYDLCECGGEKRTIAKTCMTCRPPHGGRYGTYPLGSELIDSGGYVLVKVGEHPRSRNGWIRQHVHVMEHQLGRYLLPGETVHHKNGIRTDNHPSNLELWAVLQQPSGQRVEDLLLWADEVQAVYGSDSIEIGMVMC